MQLTPPQVRALESLTQLNEQRKALQRQLREVEKTYNEEHRKTSQMMPELFDAVHADEDV
jgi:uncharacterized protein YlxW (UPF0749 family)